MKAADIETQEDMHVWLKGQSREVCVWIAARAAARVLPLYWQRFAQNTTAQDGQWTTLPVCRALLTASSIALVRDEAIRLKLAIASGDAVHSPPGRTIFTDAASAARAASEAAFAGALRASDAVSADAFASAFDASRAAAHATAADEASHTVRAATDASADTRAATLDDARWVEAHGLTAARPLWPEGMPDEIAQAWQATLRALPEPAGDQPDYRSFWVPWYQGLLDGKPAFPRALTEAVALIDEADWKKGDLHINNTVIPGLMAEHVKADAVRGERIERAPSGKLTRVAITDLPEDIRARAVARTLEALDDLRHMAGEGGNQLYAIFLPSVSVIERAVGRAGQDSVRLFETLEDATTRIATVAREQGLSDDAEVTVVLANFDRSRHEIWNGDPVVREVQTVRPGPALEKLPRETQRAVHEIGAMVREEADPDLAQDMAEDRAELDNPDSDPTERKRALQRHASRIVQTINIWIFEGSEKIAQIKAAVNNYGWLGAVLLGLWALIKGNLP